MYGSTVPPPSDSDMYFFHSGPNVDVEMAAAIDGRFSSHSGGFSLLSDSRRAFTIHRRMYTHNLHVFESALYGSVSSSNPPQEFLMPSIIAAFKLISSCFAAKSASMMVIIALIRSLTA